MTFIILYIQGEDSGSNKGSSISLRAQDSVTSKPPSSANSESSLADVEAEVDQEVIDISQVEQASATLSPLLSPTESDISEPQSALVNQSQEPSWREVTVSGGE